MITSQRLLLQVLVAHISPSGCRQEEQNSDAAVQPDKLL
jgi:hypothetical protein